MVELLFLRKLVWSWCDEAALAYAVAVAAGRASVSLTGM
jgi:hypothetical protein